MKLVSRDFLPGQATLFALLDALPAPVCLTDQSLVIRYANPAFTDLFGEARNKTCHRVIFNHNAPCTNCPAEKVFDKGVAAKAAKCPLTKEYNVHHIPLGGLNGKTFLLQFWQDRDTGHGNVKPLFEGESFSREIIDALPEQIAILDRNGTILTVNRAWRDFARTSYQSPHRSLEGDNYLQLCREAGKTDHDIDSIGRGIKEVLDGTSTTYSLEYRNTGDSDGNWLMARVNHFTSNNQKRAIVSFSPITELKRAEKEIEKLAYYDNLTSLPNRLHLNDRLHYALDWARREKESLAVMFLDLDHFKVINDSLGHSAGDELLKAVAERLTNCMRKTDTVARLGGDEFVVLLPNIRRISDVSNLARKILQSLTTPFKIKDREIFTSTSIGISLFPDDGNDAETLIRNADLAMYQAKEHGRNAYQFFSEEMNQKLLHRLEIEAGLRRAIDRNEFSLVFQDQFDVKNSRLSGTEALLRWNHPTDGVLPPSAFLDIAEETGLIVPIGNWVIQEACRVNRQWNDLGPAPLTISVNISHRQLMQIDLVDTIRDALQDSDLDPALLRLEITEGAVRGNFEQVQRVLNDLDGLGIKIAIDSFGSGFSSLAQLQHLPLDRLNIDHSFVNDISTGAQDTAIIRSIIATAHNLRLAVVAEGVETDQQHNFLRTHGCDFIQGFHFNRPVSFEEMTNYMQQEATRKASGN